MKKNIITTLLLLVVSVLNATEYMFRHLEIKDGLSNHQINNIFKDKEGFIWFSTAAGLNRYDGTEVLSYLGYDFDKDAFANNYIYNVQQDYWGTLWIHTPQGYTLYNPSTEELEKDLRNWMLNNGMDGEPQLTFIDSAQQMWLYIPQKGIYLFIPQTKLLYTLFYSNELMPQGILCNLTECKEGLLLLFEDGKIACLERENGKVKWEVTTIAKETAGVKHMGINGVTDSDGDTWIYSSAGAWVYNTIEKKWKNHLTAPLEERVSKSITSITQDSYGNIWIGSKEDGIYILNKKSLEVTQLEKKKYESRSLQCNAIQSLYTDNHGTVWVGTATQGLSFYNESSFKYGFDSLGDINCLKEDKEGIIWLGINNSGLFCWDRAKKELEQISDSKDILRTATITTILHSKDGSCWIGTQKDGLLRYHKGAVTYYEKSLSSTNSLASNSIRNLVEDQEGTLWIGTADSGVQSLNPQTNQFTTYNVANAQIASNQIYSLIVSNKKSVVIGTERGVSILNLETKQVTPWSGTKSGNATLSSSRITQLYEDSRGLLWIGTYDGLNIYQQKNDELKLISLNSERNEQTISAIIEDANKDIWVATANEVISIIPTLNEQGGYELQAYPYGEKDGLQRGRFNSGAIEKTVDGELLFGGTYGINYINPNAISYNKVYPNVRFTHLYLSNKEIKIGEVYNGKIILTKSLNEQKEILLSPQKELLEVHFSTDDYIVPQGVSYTYKLEGFSDEWISTTSGKVTYTNLHSGEYTLRVKAINSDGFGSGEEFTLGITITTPLALSIGKYLIYALLLILLALGGYFILNKQPLKKIRERKKEKEELEELEEAVQPPLKVVTNKSYSSSSNNEMEEKLINQTIAKEPAAGEPYDGKSSVEQINPMIYTIDNIMAHEEQEDEDHTMEYGTEDHSELHVVQTIYLDHQGTESLELIQTAIAKNIDYEEEGEEEEKKLIETTQEIIRSSNKLREKEQRATLLIVDDNDDMLAFIHENLQKEYELVMANNGYEAWKLMETVTPDLIISDLEMPYIDGNELSRLVRSQENLAKIPFMLLLARQVTDGNTVAQEVDTTLTKPFSKASLVEKIQLLLERELTDAELTNKKKSSNNAITPTDEKLVEKAVKYVEKNLSNSDLSIDELSQSLGVNRTNLYKKLWHATGKTPAEFIRYIRLKRAAQLLQEGRFNRAEVASQVGFSNQRNFDKFFEKEYGVAATATEKESLEQ